MTKTYYRPIVEKRHAQSDQHQLAGGWIVFSRVEVITQQGSEIVDADSIPTAALKVLTEPRAPIAGLDMAYPRVMGILNTTPDSFSDGGRFLGHGEALSQATMMQENGADILDIGGESTRPGADFVDIDDEIARTVPVIEALTQGNAPLSIDTRKSAVARAALNAGATLVNDVSGLCFDRDMGPVAAETGAPVCIMHAQGDPKTMQKDPTYDNVLLDVFDWLEAQIDIAVAQGIHKSSIVVDPGIGFGKTLDHNLALMRGLSLFHGLGCAVLLGASRKRFIGTISGEDVADKRMPGSVTVALEGLAQGMQFTRVHDVPETRQAFDLWQAINA